MQNNLLFDSIIEAKVIQFRKDGISEKEINDRIKRWEIWKESYTREDALLSFASDSINRVCNNLIPEDSSEGYLQYLFFYVMGEEFALYWHAYYGQKAIICNQNELEYYLNYYDKTSQFELDTEPVLKLRNIDIEPIIELDSIQCTIELYEILTHQGIFRRIYTIKREPPYCVVKVGEQQIAEIKCHVFY